MGACAGAYAEFSNTPREETWCADGTVFAIATTPATTYIGGNFSYVGPDTGSFMPVDTATGALLGANLKVNGPVYAIAADGAGGWYIGGTFTKVGAIGRQYLAHILSDGAVDPAWDPHPTGVSVSINALALSGTTIYVGGNFSSIGGQTRHRIAALDAVTGLATAWNPTVSGVGFVSTIKTDGTTVYAAGSFENIGGQDRNYIAALDVTTGLATAWSPVVNGYIDDVALSGSIVYIGGSFTEASGEPRNNIAAIDAATGLATTWDPNVTGTPSPHVEAVKISGTTIYIGGQFTTIGADVRSGIAAIDATTGLATAWNPIATGPNLSLYDLAISGNTVYAVGLFSNIGGQDRHYLAALDTTTGLATDWYPTPSGVPKALALSGSTIGVGGSFYSIGGQLRNNIAALDPATGTLTDWNPNANNTVRSLAVSGNTVYAGGNFSTVGGQTRHYIAAVDGTTGSVTAWDPNANSSYVYALAATDSTVYAGGQFTNIGGQPRNRIAALDAATGLATAWDPSSNGTIYALIASGASVFAGGSYSTIGGQDRFNIAELDASSGLATAWVSDADGRVNTMLLSGNTLYAGGAFSAIGGETHSCLAALDAVTGAPTAWNPGVEGSWSPSVSALALSGNTLYIGGSFTVAGADFAFRSYLAAIALDTGLARAWNPSLDNTVYSVAIQGTALYAGGTFETIGGIFRPGFAEFEGSESIPPTVTISRPPSQPTLTNTVPILFDVVFSEAVTGFNAADVTQTGSAAGVVFSVTENDAAHYTVSATAAAGDGTIHPIIAAEACTDLAGNGNLASTGADATVTLDRQSPTIAIGMPNPSHTSTGPVTYFLTYSEPCTIALAASDIELHSTGSATGEVLLSGSGATARTVTVQNISGDGALWIMVYPMTDRDSAGNLAEMPPPSMAIDVMSTLKMAVTGTTMLVFLTTLLAAAALLSLRKRANV